LITGAGRYICPCKRMIPKFVSSITACLDSDRATAPGALCFCGMPSFVRGRLITSRPFYKFLGFISFLQVVYNSRIGFQQNYTVVKNCACPVHLSASVQPFFCVRWAVLYLFPVFGRQYCMWDQQPLN
jgi:hypothetical protein